MKQQKPAFLQVISNSPIFDTLYLNVDSGLSRKAKNPIAVFHLRRFNNRPIVTFDILDEAKIAELTDWSETKWAAATILKHSETAPLDK